MDMNMDSGIDRCIDRLIDFGDSIRTYKHTLQHSTWSEKLAPRFCSVKPHPRGTRPEPKP
eukprot:6191725-Pleurochrysis_carterae.AAC.1